MPARKTNGKKGGKTKRRKAKPQVSREITTKQDGQEYARVTKLLGNLRCETKCFDGKDRIATIRGSMAKKVWINKGDLVLISLRDFQDGKGDIIHKYRPDEERKLKKSGEIKEEEEANDVAEVNNEQFGFTFEDI